MCPWFLKDTKGWAATGTSYRHGITASACLAVAEYSSLDWVHFSKLKFAGRCQVRCSPREVACKLSSFQVAVFKDFYRLRRQVKPFLPLTQSLLNGLPVPLSTLPQTARCNYHPQSMNSYCDNIVFWVNSKSGSKGVRLINVMLIHSTTFNSAKAP